MSNISHFDSFQPVSDSVCYTVGAPVKRFFLVNAMQSCDCLKLLYLMQVLLWKGFLHLWSVLIWWFCNKIKKQILIYACKDYFIWAAAACNLREEIEVLRWLEHCDLPNEQVSLWKLPLRVPLSKTLST